MSGPKKSKEKFGTRALRGVRAAKSLTEDTQARMVAGFAKIVAGNYDTQTLINDVMGQASDFMDAVRDFMGGDNGPPELVLVVAANNVPVKDTVLLSDSVQGANLKPTDLVGVSNAGNAVVIPKNSYTVLRPDETPIPNNEEVEQVLVKLTVAPPATGVYRGALMAGTVKVLAELVVVSTT
jgi:hypothetical protein